MTIQFKKFLLLLASLAIGILTFNLLVLIFNSKGAETFVPVAEFIDIVVSIASMFLYYFLLKKLLHFD